MTSAREQRLAALIAALSSPGPHSAADLAARLAIAPRTFKGDLDDLIAAGYPIEGDAHAGYAMVRLSRLPSLTLTETDLNALRLAVSNIKGPAAEHLMSFVNSAVSEPIGGLDLGSLTMDVITRGMRASARHLPALRAAIHRRVQVRMRYYDKAGAVSDRTVIPLGLERWGAAWALVAWCDLRNDFRTFRLDRVESLEVTDQTIRPRLGRDLATFMALHRNRDD
jgi:predicted DNA-binding transcriptional regulator YafY